MIGIYSITNKINGRVYVGQTDNINRRFNHHLNKLLYGNNPISELQKDFNIYWEDAFEFKIEQECTLEELDELEKYWIKKLNAFEDNGGYNSQTGGKSGYDTCQRVKDLISKKAKENFKNNEEYYNAVAKHNKEMWDEPGYREKMSKTFKERYENNPELREEVSKQWKEIWEREGMKEGASQRMKERYEDPEERKKTAEATKAGMAKLSKEKLSRRHLCKVPNEILIKMTRERYLTINKMAEKYNVSLQMAKNIKCGKHHIYEYMEENNIPIIKIPKKKNFMSSISPNALMIILKEKDLDIEVLINKYKVARNLINVIKSGEHWIYEYIELNNINLDNLNLDGIDLDNLDLNNLDDLEDIFEVLY